MYVAIFNFFYYILKTINFWGIYIMEDLTFEDLGLDEITLAAIEKKGFVTPSPIQTLAIPRLLEGDANVIAKARTGTGKTAAFGLPIVQKIREESDHVRAIILEPTRELAQQTALEMSSFTTGKFPRSCVVYGGASIGMQIKDLKRGAEIVVGTPGRIQDLMERGVLDISRIEYFILDEGDEMLDMGFVDDIENIFEKASKDCRVLLFSATIPKEILSIAGKFMGEYEIVEEEGVQEEPLLIDQKYWVVREADKVEALVRLIDNAPNFYGLVFVQRKTDADFVSKQLDEKGYEAAALHGDIPQGQREKILARFRSGKTRILVATDVAARGIDISGLTHVVNYELPFDGPTYVHRIGRTGRAGSEGFAVTFVRPDQRRKMEHLRYAIKKSAKGEMCEGVVPSIEEVLEAKKSRLFDDVKIKLGLKEEILPGAEKVESEKFADEEIVASGVEIPVVEKDVFVPSLKKGDEIFDKLSQELCENQDPVQVVSALLALTYGKILNKKHYGKITTFGQGSSAKKNSGVKVGSDQIRVYVQLGWMDGYNPKKIADFFVKLLHIQGRQVDKIDMSEKFCLVSLPVEAGKKALELAARDKKLPHMHQDIKNGGIKGSGRTHIDFDGKRQERYSVAKGERKGRRDSGRSFGGKSKSGRRNDHSRANVHTPTERQGSAGLYKKNRKSDEY